MTFELSPEARAMRDRARAFAQTIGAQAADVDRLAAVPDELARQLPAFRSSDLLVTVVALEEIAMASAAVATSVVAGHDARVLGLSGLRGAGEPANSPHTQLALAAIALGVGRAAVEAALADLRRAIAPPTGAEKPHWLVADVATDLDAARLLTYKAAATARDADIAQARLLASAAAQRAVEAAVRVTGVSALEQGSALDRLSRDVRVLSVLLGTEEDHRAVAAEGLLPQ